MARRQLLGLGVGGHAIDGRIARGYLHPIHRGVYVVGYRRISRKGRWLAAVLAAGPSAVLSHRGAGCLHGFLPPGLDRVEVTTPPGSRRRRPRVLCHEGALAADEADELDGIPVTGLFRTFLDLAGCLGPRQLERAWREAEVRRLTDRVPLATILDRHRGARGVVALRRLDASLAPIPFTRSELEERFLALLDACCLPRPRFNASLHLRGRFFELDCLWERERLIVELDGAAAHRTDHAFQADRHRDRTLLAEGYRTTRVTWEQLRDEPREVAADIRAALEPGRSPPPPDK